MSSVGCFDNSTVRLDSDNGPQPNLALINLPGHRGQACISENDYIEGVPELAVETVGGLQAPQVDHGREAGDLAGASGGISGARAPSGWSPPIRGGFTLRSCFLIVHAVPEGDSRSQTTLQETVWN